MTSADLDAQLEAAVGVMREAGDLALSRLPPPGAPQATLKGAQDWLTEADGAVEAFIARRIGELFPEDGFQGEEGGHLRAGRRRWVVDPIDGTANFARGGSRWCVSLGLIEGTTPLLGVLVAPALGEVYAARRGGRATLNGRPIRTAATDDMARATIEIGWSRRRPDSVFHAMCAGVKTAGAALRAGGSGAMGLADVASGRIDGYIEAHINLWDVAAGLCILAEAGAYVSPYLEGPGPTEGDMILAAAPGVAAAVREIGRR
jgi:myo-inositol-1(or 4)-monophosphatase